MIKTLQFLIRSLSFLSQLTSANPLAPAIQFPNNDIFPYSYQKQEAIQSVQNEIDDVIADVQIGFFMEVQNSSEYLLQHIEDLANTVSGIYASILDDFDAVKKGECRDGVESIINLTRSQSGYTAGNCATRVNKDITSILARNYNLFENFNRQFSEIQQIVVKSFIKNNLFIDKPEEVIRKMDDNYNLVKARWDELKPDFTTLRAALRNELIVEDAKFAICHFDVMEFVESMYRNIRGQIDECNYFENNANARASAANGRDYIAEAMTLSNNFKARFSEEE